MSTKLRGSLKTPSFRASRLCSFVTRFVFCYGRKRIRPELRVPGLASDPSGLAGRKNKDTVESSGGTKSKKAKKQTGGGGKRCHRYASNKAGPGVGPAAQQGDGAGKDGATTLEEVANKKKEKRGSEDQRVELDFENNSDEKRKDMKKKKKKSREKNKEPGIREKSSTTTEAEMKDAKD